MPENVLYRAEWTRGGRQYRLDIIPRSTADLPALYDIVLLPDGVISDDWTIDNSAFPSEKPIGLPTASTITLNIDALALSATSQLQDLRTYLLDPIKPGGGTISVGSGSKSVDTTNVVVLYTDNGDGTSPDDAIFIGAQKLKPGFSGELERPGSDSQFAMIEFTFTHIALHIAEKITTAWIATEALDNETPIGGPGVHGGFEEAYNLLYFDSGTIYALAEAGNNIHGTVFPSSPVFQEFFCYSLSKLFTTHLRRLLSDIYDVLLRNAYTGVGVDMYSGGGGTYDKNDAGAGPYKIVRVLKQEHSPSYGSVVPMSQITDFYMKGKIVEGPSAEVIGGWYYEKSRNSIFQWNNAWDFLKASCDGAMAKCVIAHTTPIRLEFHFLPENRDVQIGGSAGAFHLITSDTMLERFEYAQSEGMVKGASVQLKTSGSLDVDTHEATASGINSEEDIPITCVFHNQIPLGDIITPSLDIPASADGQLNVTPNGGSYTLRGAQLHELTTDTLYAIYAPKGPGGEDLTLSDGVGGFIEVPVLLNPAIDIYRDDSDFFTGYDITTFTPLPTGAANNWAFRNEIEGTVILAQENACLPHSIAQFLINEFGTGNVTKPVRIVTELDERDARFRILGDVFTFSPSVSDVVLPTGETFFSVFSSAPQLIALTPDYEKGTVEVVLLGRS